ncbi:MAG: hypothetical protein ACRD8Z_08805 [Nitrososphaeraceae archaeon]
MTCALPSSRVSDVSNRNLNAGVTETYFKIVIDVDGKNRPRVEQFSLVDDRAHPDSRLNSTYVKGFLELITCMLARQGFTLKGLT